LAEADLAAHRAAGRVGPNTIIVEIMRFDEMTGAEPPLSIFDLSWIAAWCLETFRQRSSAIVAMVFSNLTAQSASGLLAHRNQTPVRQT
jgi:hypothetical protein